MKYSQINGAEDTVELQAALAIDEVQEVLLQTGFRKPLVKLTAADKDDVSSAIIDFHLMAKVKCTMDQFIEGLEACGLLAKIKEQPTLREPMFVHSNASKITRDINTV